MLYAKPCCAVDPIENEEDRKKVRHNSLAKILNVGDLPWAKTQPRCPLPCRLPSMCTSGLERSCVCFSLQAVTNINTLLDKADRVYHQLMGHRPQLESLLSKVNEAAPEKPQVSHSERRYLMWVTHYTRLSVCCCVLDFVFQPCNHLSR